MEQIFCHGRQVDNAFKVTSWLVEYESKCLTAVSDMYISFVLTRAQSYTHDCRAAIQLFLQLLHAGQEGSGYSRYIIATKL